MKKALAVVQAAYSSYSSCRQYREDIARAQAAAGPGAPQVDKMRVFYNHPDFIAANAERVRDALGRFSSGRTGDVHLAFTAHSIPICDGSELQVRAPADRGVSIDRRGDRHSSQIGGRLVYQSRSGRPGDPWLEPDILDISKT